MTRGNGQADNVLIRTKTNNCLLVDFEGSYTEGWVDAELKETSAGDQQAVVKIAILHMEIHGQLQNQYASVLLGTIG